MQEFLRNPIFQTVKCIIYVGLTDVGEKLLSWDYNTYSDYRIPMRFIQRVIFIHNEFEQICGGDKSKFYADFWKQCCIEIGLLIKEDNVK